MRVGGMVILGAARGAPESRGRRPGRPCPWAWLLFVALAASAAPAPAAELEGMAADVLPWSALPGTHPGARPLQLAIPRIPIVAEADPYLADWSAEPPQPAIAAALWSSENGSVVLGFAIDQEQDNDDQPGDRLFGDLRKRYTAVFAFDQPLGFSTALIVDVLSKDKRRGQREFKVLQIAVSRPFGEDGSLSAGSALVLNGLKPELNIGIRLFLPLGAP
jgi:hypothetical protein